MENEKNMFGERLQLVREHRQMNQSELARRLGVSPQAVQKWEAGGMPKATRINEIARVLFLSPEELLYGDLQKILSKSSDAEPPHDTLMVPVSSAWGSMGLGAPQPEHEAIVAGLTVSMDWVRHSLPRISHPSRLAVLTAFGRSMEPTLEDGDTMLVDRGVSEIREDGIFVISLDDELYVKRVQRRLPDKAIIIKSDNPHYEPMVVENGDRNKLEILGRVVWVWKGIKL